MRSFSISRYTKRILYFSIACLLAGTSFYASAFFDSASTGVVAFSPNSSNTIDWSSLRGANYGSNFNYNLPSSSFSDMAGYGWNFIRVPVSWAFYLKSSNYITTLDQIATNANSYGISIVWDFHAGSTWNTQEAFPSTLLSQFSNVTSFYRAWWTNQTVYNGQNGWSYQWNSFWKPLIQNLNSYPATVGYEIMNEPPLVSGVARANMQQYNTYMAQQMATITSKAIVFMGAYNCIGCGPQGYPGGITGVAPQGIANLAIDAHEYNPGSISSDFAGINTASQDLGGIPVIIGEWAVCAGSTCTVSQSQAQTEITSFTQGFQQYGFANTYWGWYCGSSQMNLLDSNCQTYWIDNEISQTYNQVYGNAGSSTTTATTISSSTTTASTASTSFSTSATTDTSSSSQSPDPSLVISNSNPSLGGWVDITGSGLPASSSVQVDVFNNSTNTYAAYLYPSDTSSSGTLSFSMQITSLMAGVDTVFLFSPDTAAAPLCRLEFNTNANSTNTLTTTTTLTNTSTSSSTALTTSNASVSSSTTSAATSTYAMVSSSTQGTTSLTFESSFSTSTSNSTSTQTHGHNGQIKAQNAPQNNAQGNGNGNRKKTSSTSTSTTYGSYSLADLTGGVSSILSPSTIITIISSSNNPPAAYGFATYEITLIGGMIVLFGNIAKSKKNEYEVRGWRW